MKILIYSHFYFPEVGAASIRMQYFVKALKSANHEVRIISPIPNYPQGKVYEGFNRFYFNDKKNNIIYLPIILPSKHNLLNRGLSYLSYFIISFFFILFSTFKPDVILSTSPPLFTAFGAAIISRLRRSRFVVDLRDIWPDIGIELGLLKHKSIIKVLKKIENFILKSAAKIIVTAEGDKKNIICKGIQSSDIEVIFNGADVDLFKPTDDVTKIEIRKKFNLPISKKIIVYFGFFNHGMNDIELLGEALIKLTNMKSEFHFLAIGDGDKRKDFFNSLSDKIEYTYLKALQNSEVAELIPACDLSIIPLKKIERNTGGFIPVKCFESWAAGVPVLLASIRTSEISQIFSNCRAGILVEPGNIEEFVKAIKTLISNSNLGQIAKIGRPFVIAHYNRKKEANKINKVIDVIKSN